jgi:conjugative relaxase-like TrwC/TraI family protein
MLDITAVNSVEYYRDQDKDSRRETLQYHTDNETIERGHGMMGTWFVLGDPSESYSSAIVEGEAVRFEDLEALTRDENPDDGTSYDIKRSGSNKTCARDLTLSAPKPVSVLHGIGKAAGMGAEQEAAMFKLIADITHDGHNHGVRAGLQLAFDEQAFAVRFGKGGKNRAGATFVAAAKFDHFTSRDGDMQLHSHVVFPNIARAPDGTVRAWDNHKLTVLKGKVSAAYRAEMVDYIKTECAKHGIRIHFSKDGRNFKIDGIDPEITQHFSKRRTAILNKMYENGYTNTANHRKAAQMVSYGTRRDKSQLPPVPELYDRWKFELAALGHSPGSLLEAIHDTARDMDKAADDEWKKIRAEAAENGETLPELRPDLDVENVARHAVENITAMDSVFERAKFETTMLEELQTVANASTALATIEAVKNDGAYVRVGVKGRSKEGVYTDTHTLTQEYEFMDLETSMRGNVAAIDPKFIRQAIAEGVEKTDGSGERFHLNKEQEALVWHLLSGSQRTDGIGDAGTGKTTTMIVVRRALELAGYELHLAAPTNKAVTGLAKELGIPIERGMSVARFIQEYEKGNLKLGPKSYVILDEAGMVDRVGFLKLDRIAKATGCRIGAVGDPKQLPPVQAGAPFRMTTEAFGAGRLLEIARQKEAWARQASKDLAGGNVKDGIMAYADRGHLHILDSTETVYDKTIETVMEFERANPGNTLLISPTNSERRHLTRRVIEQKIEAGIYTGEPIFVDHYERGSDDVHNSAIYQGSTIALAETVTYEGERYPNNAIGQVVKIERQGDLEPFVTVKWEDGRQATFQPSKFVGFREEGDKNANVPRFAPADCLTEYQSQGLSIPNVVRPFTSATTTQSAYVSMTRHKQNFVGIIDGSRIENDLTTKEGKTFYMEKGGASRQEDDRPETVVTKETILERFIEECERTNSKANACDFLGGAKSFHENYREHYDAKFSLTNDLHKPESREEKNMDNQAEQKPDAEANAEKIAKRNAIPNFRVRGIGRTGAQVANVEATAGAKELAQIAERRIAATAEPEIAKSPKVQAIRERIAANKIAKENPRDRHQFKGGRITPEEMEMFSRHNLKEYVEKNGGNIRDKHKDEGTRMSAGVEYQMEHPALGKFAVTQFRGGSWGFMTFDKTTNGNIAEFKAAVEGISKMEAYHALRHEFGTAPTESSGEFKAKSKVEMSFRDRMEKVLAEPAKQAKEWIATNWEAAQKGIAAYLYNRGLTRETLTHFADDIRLEGKQSRDGRNDGGVMFAMRDGAGNLTGYTRKGSQIDPDTGAPIARAAGGSVKHLVRMGDQTDPKRIYVGETVIDCMSRWQMDGSPEKTLLVATSGRMNEREQADLYELAKRHPGAEWNHCRQNDEIDPKTGQRPNDVHLAETRQAVLEANPQAQFIERKPPENVKDWNDVVKAEFEATKAQSKPQEPTESRQNNRDQEAQIRAERQRQQEEARRKAEEEKNKNGPSR